MQVAPPLPALVFGTYDPTYAVRQECQQLLDEMVKTTGTLLFKAQQERVQAYEARNAAHEAAEDIRVQLLQMEEELKAARVERDDAVAQLVVAKNETLRLNKTVVTLKQQEKSGLKQAVDERDAARAMVHSLLQELEQERSLSSSLNANLKTRTAEDEARYRRLTEELHKLARVRVHADRRAALMKQYVVENLKMLHAALCRNELDKAAVDWMMAVQNGQIDNVLKVVSQTQFSSEVMQKIMAELPALPC
jgi:hypothetical protein